MTGEGSTTVVSGVDATFDLLIERASVPNLAALFGQAKERGLIKPGKEYGSTN
jgi:hypothetical protein